MDYEATLDAILVNQNQKADETINALETIIAQNEENKLDTILEAQLVTQKELLDSHKELIKTIQERENEPIEIKFEIVGGEAKIIETEDEEND